MVVVEPVGPGVLSARVGSGAGGPIIEAVRELTRGLNSVNLSRLPPAARCELQFWLALMLNRTGDPLRQRRMVAKALDDLSGRPDLRAWGMIGLGTPCGAPGVPLSAHLRWLHRSLDVLPRLSDPALRVLLLGQVASILVVVGDPAWRRIADRILSRTGDAPTGTAAASAHEVVGAAACYAGHHELARRLLAAAGRAPLIDDHHRGRVLARLALLDYCHGRWDTLRHRTEPLIADLAGDARTDAEVVAGCLALAHGDLDQARQRIAGTIESIAHAGHFDLLPLPATALVRLAVTTGEADLAVSTAQQVLAGAESRGAWAPAVRVLPWLVAALAAAGQAADAAGVLHRVREQLRGLHIPLGPAATAHAQGVLTADHRQWLPAAGHLLTAADRYELSGCRYEAAQARERAAECLFAAGDPRTARVLRAAVATYQRLGAAWDVSRAGRTALRLGMPLPAYHRDEGRGEGDRLSPRQRQVAQLAAAGLTNEEIAHRLHLSHRTVDKHVGAALRRLGVHSRKSLANYL